MEVLHCFQRLNSQWSLTIILIVLQVVNAVLTIYVVEETQTISAQNGSSSVVIDCPYRLDKDNDTEGLVVKWYYNSKPLLVYQWIPGNMPQELGMLTHRLDKTYKVSKEAHSQHRALAIMEPTIDLSGSYKCTVSNFNSEINMFADLHVYIPASSIYITTNTSEGKDILLVSCRAEGLFPKPDMDLFLISPDETDPLRRNRNVMDEENEFLAEDDTHVISLEKAFLISELESISEFVCRISIPNTDYVEERKTKYYSSPHAFGSEDASGAATTVSRSKILRWVFVCFIIAVFSDADKIIS